MAEEEKPKKKRGNRATLIPITKETRHLIWKPEKKLIDMKNISEDERMKKIVEIIFSETEKFGKITVVKLAKLSGLSRRVLCNYMVLPEFSKVYKAALKAAAILHASPSLLKVAQGMQTKTITYEQDIKRLNPRTKKSEYVKAKIVEKDEPPDVAALKLILGNLLPELYPNKSEVDINTRNMSAVFLIPQGDGKMQLPGHLNREYTEEDIKKLKEKNPDLVIPEEVMKSMNKGKNE